MRKKTIFFGAIVLLVSAVALTVCKSTTQSAFIPGAFKPVPVDFVHKWDKHTHPFTGAAVIDFDGDGSFEFFVGGGEGQADALFSYQNGKLINIEAGTGLSDNSATHGATAIDIDGDADTDLLVARNDGVYLYLNDGGKFQQELIAVDLPAESVPFNIAISDIDHDGDGDLYVSAFVAFPSFRSATFNDPAHAKTNRLLLNNGDQTFTDITEASGTASKQNTFLSTFIDLDMDGWQDIVVAQNTGQVEIFRNMKDKTFEAVDTKTAFGFWMGIAAGDIDKDGDQDLFFSNVGKSIPEFLTKGDIGDYQSHTHDWLLLRNDGEFRFTDITEAYQLGGEGFAWGAVFEDLDLDGKLDLLVAQNYIKWPVHKVSKLSGRTFLQTEENGTPVFQQGSSMALENKYFGQSPLIVDLDGDGRQDVVWVNIDGPLRAFLNTSTANFLTVSVPDTVASLGTRFTVEIDSGKSYTRDIIAGLGMLTDQTPEVSFGLGAKDKIRQVIIQRPNGVKEFISAPAINTRVLVR